MDFVLYPLRFYFRTLDSVHFPPGKAGNVLRGAFGVCFREAACNAECRRAYPSASDCPQRDECRYVRMFEPAANLGGPSGFADAPRPFVLRAAHLDGVQLPSGRRFAFDIHSFEASDPPVDLLIRALNFFGDFGLGPSRGRVQLEAVAAITASGSVTTPVGVPLTSYHPPPVRISLNPALTVVKGVRLRFLTPTELKADSHVQVEPEFAILFARLRDRVSLLHRLYGGGPLDIDFAGMAQRAAAVRIGDGALRWETVERRSSRTGQSHPLGGFLGEVEYHGELTEFLPWLAAGYWTGVGRQTVWGKGVFRVIRCF